MKELGMTLVETFQKADLLSLLQEYGEVGIDSITTNPAVEKIPLIGTVLALAKAGIGLREVLFVKKLIKFLSESSLNDPERAAFASKISEIHDEKIGERILSAIDKIEDEIKAGYIGRLFKSYSQGGVSCDSLKRAIRAIEMAYTADLELVTLTPHELQFKDASITDGLYAIGLLEIGADVRDYESHVFPVNSKKYKASSLGALVSSCVFKSNTKYSQGSGRGFMNTYITPFYKNPKPYMGE